MRRICLLAIGIMFSVQAIAFAEGIPYSYEQAEWFVISEKGTAALKSAFPIKSSLGKGNKVCEINVSRDNARVCVKSKADGKKCALVFHPDQAFKGDKIIGNFAIHKAADNNANGAWEVLAKKLGKIKKDVWTKSKHDHAEYLHLDDKITTVMMTLLDMYETSLAHELYNGLAELDYDKQKAARLLYLLYGQEKRLKNAEKVYKELTSDGADDPVIKAIKARVLSINGEIEKGAKLLAEAVANRPKGSELRCEQSFFTIQLINKGNREGASDKVWQTFRNEFPDCLNLYTHQIWKNINTKDIKDACDICDEAMKAFPDNPQLIFAKAFILYRQGNYTEAANMVISLSKVRKNNSEILFLNNQILSAFNEQEAKDYLKVATKELETDQSNLMFGHAIGYVNYNLGNFDDAIKAMLTIEPQLKTKESVYRILAMSYYYKNDTKAATKWIESFEKAIPQSDTILRIKAIFFSKKDIDKSKAFLKQYMDRIKQDGLTDEKFILQIQNELNSLDKGVIPPKWEKGPLYKAENIQTDREEG